MPACAEFTGILSLAGSDSRSGTDKESRRCEPRVIGLSQEDSRGAVGIAPHSLPEGQGRLPGGAGAGSRSQVSAPPSPLLSHWGP